MGISTILGSIQTLVTGLITGIFVAMVVTATARVSLEITNFVKFQQDLHYVFGTMMPPFALASIVVGIIWLISLRRQFKSPAFLLAALSTLGAIAALFVSFRTNFPINDILVTWNAASPPADAKEIWMPWERAHVIRTVFYAISFVSAVTANNFSRSKS